MPETDAPAWPPADIYQRIFEYTPDALFIVDRTGHIVLANAQAEALFGYDRSELLQHRSKC